MVSIPETPISNTSPAQAGATIGNFSSVASNIILGTANAGSTYRMYGGSTAGDNISSTLGGISQITSSLNSLTSDIINRKEVQQKGNLEKIMSYIQQPDILGQEGLSKSGFTKDQATAYGNKLIDDATAGWTTKNVQTTVDLAKSALSKFVYQNTEANSATTMSKYLTSASSQLNNLTETLPFDMRSKTNIDGFLSGNGKPDSGFFNQNSFYLLARKTAGDNPKLLEQLDKFRNDATNKLYDQSTLLQAKNIVSDAKSFYSYKSGSYQDYRSLLNTPESKHADSVILQSMGDVAGKEFIRQNKISALSSAVNDMKIPSSLIVQDGRSYGMTDDQIQHLLEIRQRRINSIAIIDTIDPVKLAESNPDASIINNQLDLHARGVSGVVNLDQGFAKTVEDIQNDTSISEGEKAYKTNLAKQLFDRKKDLFTKNPLDYAIATGLATPNGQTKVSPENKYTDRVALALQVRSVYGGGLKFFTSKEEDAIKLAPSLKYNDVQSMMNVLAHDPNKLRDFRDEMKSAGSNIADLIDLGVTQQNLADYERNIKTKEIGDKFVMSQDEFVDKISHPVKTSIGQAFTFNAEQKGIKYDTGISKAFSADEWKAANMISKDTALQTKLYEAYKIKSIAQGDYSFKHIPSAKSLLESAGFKIYDTGLYGSTIYYRSHKDPTKAIQNIQQNLNSAGNFYRAQLGGVAGLKEQAISNILNKGAGVNTIEIFANQQNIRDKYELRNLDPDTLGLYYKGTGSPVIDPRTNKQFISQIE